MTAVPAARMEPERSVPEIDLAAPAFNADPYPHFVKLREAGIARTRHAMFGDGVVVARYADVKRVLDDEQLASDRKNALGSRGPADAWWMPKLLSVFERNMVSSDDPAHARLRSLVHLAFTPKRVEALNGTIRRIVGELLDAIAKKAAGGQAVDLIADFALPLPLEVISLMMGVPPGRDRQRFHHLTSTFLEVGGPAAFLLLKKVPNALRMVRYFRKLIRLRREEPGDDLLTALVQAEEQGDRLSEDELVAMVFVLLLAGHETTVNLIGSGTLALLEHPDELARLRANPELITPGIEELLRYANPVVYPGPRWAKQDFELHGVTVKRGTSIIALIASANRDPEVFKEPDRLDLGRTPNRHLAFGYGIHYCLGAPLARLEGRNAILELVNRFPKLRLAVPKEQLKWRISLAVRGMERMPVRVD